MDATVGRLELENQLAEEYPDLAAQLVDVLADADQAAMTAFHRAAASWTTHQPANVPDEHSRL